MFWQKDYVHFKIICYSVMYVFLEWGTLSITSVIYIQLLFVSSNYVYLYFLNKTSIFFVWKFWLILLLELMKLYWKVSCSLLCFLAGPDKEMIVWFNRISMHRCLRKLALTALLWAQWPCVLFPCIYSILSKS